MSKTTQELYVGMLEELEPDWREQTGYGRDSAAGVAVACAVLNGEDPNTETIPDFNAAQIKRAFTRLRKSGYFHEDGERQLVVDDEDGIDSVFYWALLQNVARGFMERVPA